MTPVQTVDDDTCPWILSFLGFILMKGGNLMECVLFLLFHLVQEQRQDRISEQRPDFWRRCRKGASGIQQGARDAVRGAAGHPGRFGKVLPPRASVRRRPAGFHTSLLRDFVCPSSTSSVVSCSACPINLVSEMLSWPSFWSACRRAVSLLPVPTGSKLGLRAARLYSAAVQRRVGTTACQQGSTYGRWAVSFIQLSCVTWNILLLIFFSTT